VGMDSECLSPTEEMLLTVGLDPVDLFASLLQRGLIIQTVCSCLLYGRK